MIVFRNYASRFGLGAMIIMPLVSATCVRAGDFGGRDEGRPIADRCGQFGPGYVDVGRGVCGRTSGHLRVYVGSRSARNTPFARSLSGTLSGGTLAGRTIPGGILAGEGLAPGSINPWSAGGSTSTAALRSDGMLAGATVTHLRVRGSLDSFSPFH